MTSATRSVAVVATQLPITDRRALSQAWYSALHVSQATAAAATHKAANGSPVRAAAVARPSAQPASVSHPAASIQREPHTGRGSEARVTAAVERRAPATDLSQRIERALLAHRSTAPVRPVTTAIKAADGRVQLLVRHDGTTTRVIALCAPHLRANVDRALARARFALAAAGSRIEAA